MPKKILIVDDEEFIHSALNHFLNQYGYIIQTSLGSDIFLEKLLFEPDLILLDKQLSGMDGAEICKFFKETEPLSNLSIILMSAITGLKTIARVAGADDFIEKPFTIAELVEKTEKHI